MTGVVVGYQSGLGYYSTASKHFCVPLLKQAPLCASSEGPLLSSEAHLCLKGMGLSALRDISMLMRPFCKILPLSREWVFLQNLAMILYKSLHLASEMH